MDGLINVLKPPGMTSHDVVDFIRRLLGIKKVGHTGTLDPGAVGVLLVCCGKATKLAEYLSHDKKYRAEIAFGAVSSTGDSFGRIEDRVIPGDFSREKAEQVVLSFAGPISQVPPMTSAVKIGGERLYKLARRGITVNRQSRQVQIYAIKPVRWREHGDRPNLLIDVWCSAGTYIRTLCQDIGERLNCGAYMSFLLRTGVGKYTVEASSTLEELKNLASLGRLKKVLVSMEDVLSFLPAVEVDEGAVGSVCSGATLYLPGVKHMPEGIRAGDLTSLIWQGKLLAVAVAAEDGSGRKFFKSKKVMAY